jgi:hypothetical protein
VLSSSPESGDWATAPVSPLRSSSQLVPEAGLKQAATQGFLHELARSRLPLANAKKGEAAGLSLEGQSRCTPRLWAWSTSLACRVSWRALRLTAPALEPEAGTTVNQCSGTWPHRTCSSEKTRPSWPGASAVQTHASTQHMTLQRSDILTTAGHSAFKSLLYPKDPGTPPLPRASQRCAPPQPAPVIDDIANGRFTWSSWADPGQSECRASGLCQLSASSSAPPLAHPRATVLPNRARGAGFWICTLASWCGAPVWPTIDPIKLIGRWRLRLRRPRHPSQACGPEANHKLALVLQPHADRAPAYSARLHVVPVAVASLLGAPAVDGPRTYCNPMHPLCRALVTDDLSPRPPRGRSIANRRPGRPLPDLAA